MSTYYVPGCLPGPESTKNHTGPVFEELAQQLVHDPWTFTIFTAVIWFSIYRKTEEYVCFVLIQNTLGYFNIVVLGKEIKINVQQQRAGA